MSITETPKGKLEQRIDGCAEPFIRQVIIINPDEDNAPDPEKPVKNRILDLGFRSKGGRYASWIIYTKGKPGDEAEYHGRIYCPEFDRVEGRW